MGRVLATMQTKYVFRGSEGDRGFQTSQTKGSRKKRKGKVIWTGRELKSKPRRRPSDGRMQAAVKAM